MPRKTTYDSRYIIQTPCDKLQITLPAAEEFVRFYIFTTMWDRHTIRTLCCRAEKYDFQPGRGSLKAGNVIIIKHPRDTGFPTVEWSINSLISNKLVPGPRSHVNFIDFKLRGSNYSSNGTVTFRSSQPVERLFMNHLEDAVDIIGADLNSVPPNVYPANVSWLWENSIEFTKKNGTVREWTEIRSMGCWSEIAQAAAGQITALRVLHGSQFVFFSDKDPFQGKSDIRFSLLNYKYIHMSPWKCLSASRGMIIVIPPCKYFATYSPGHSIIAKKQWYRWDTLPRTEMSLYLAANSGGMGLDFDQGQNLLAQWRHIVPGPPNMGPKILQALWRLMAFPNYYLPFHADHGLNVGTVPGDAEEDVDEVLTSSSASMSDEERQPCQPMDTYPTWTGPGGMEFAQMSSSSNINIPEHLLAMVHRIVRFSQWDYQWEEGSKRKHVSEE
ncbi:hypothetical protein BD410DRAFT_810707, partial [Rickenella mellea]